MNKKGMLICGKSPSPSPRDSRSNTCNTIATKSRQRGRKKKRWEKGTTKRMTYGWVGWGGGGRLQQQCVDKNRKFKWLVEQKIRRIPFYGKLQEECVSRWRPWSLATFFHLHSDEGGRVLIMVSLFVGRSQPTPTLGYGGSGAVNPTTRHNIIPMIDIHNGQLTK